MADSTVETPAVPVPHGLRRHRHGGLRRWLHLTACAALAVWIVLPLWLAPSFLPPPVAADERSSPRLRLRRSTVVGGADEAATHGLRQLAQRIRRKAAEEEMSQDSAQARIAELEAKLAEAKAAQGGEGFRSAVPAQQEAAATVPRVQSEVELLYLKIEEEMPLKKLDDARLGVGGGGEGGSSSFVMDRGNNDVSNPIYKRKYEVLGATITQQEMYMKAFNKCVNVAKKSESVKKLNELMKENKKDDKFMENVEAIKRNSRNAGLFFRDVLPEANSNPVEETITGLIATFALLFGTALFFCCLFPPIPPSADM